MKKTFIVIALLVVLIVLAVYFREDKNKQEPTTTNMPNQTTENQGDIQITPISHASLILGWKGKAIYADPVGGAAPYSGKPEANIILITDIHGDHLSTSTLESLVKENTKLVAPKAVYFLLPPALQNKTTLINNNEETEIDGFKILAVPMYNVPETESSFHTKGRGNGYIIESGGKQVYISGDTGNTPQMRALQNIDIAFVSMNLPYTMSVEDAAIAVIAFKPKTVIPYHYRGPDGLSDTAKFKELVNKADSNIKVDLLNFYPAQ